MPELDYAGVAKAIGAGARHAEPETPGQLPEPLASVVDYLGEDLDGEFVSTEELITALRVEPTLFGWQMADLGCRSTRERISGEDGMMRQVRGYRVADIRAAVRALGAGETIDEP